jgi:hypothetical protein
MNRYTISAQGDLGQYLRVNGKQARWSIVANSIESAWRKFQVQRFGALAPNPADYDVTLTGKHTDAPVLELQS